MMYLSQLFVNLRDRRARFDLGDRYELHRTIMCAFPEQIADHERVLYRVENVHQKPFVTILLQSQTIPEWDRAERLNTSNYLMSPPIVRHVQPKLQNGLRLPFRLQANPTLKHSGKRQAIYADEGTSSWLERKAQANGFMIDQLNLRTSKLGKKHGKKGTLTWHAVQFDGVLEVVDTVQFMEALSSGIGSAKAFGFGLLSIPYPRT